MQRGFVVVKVEGRSLFQGVLRGFGVKVEGLFVVVLIVNNGMLFSL